MIGLLSSADIQWAEDQLKRYTYKPGWTMELHYPWIDRDEPYLRIDFMAEDTYHPGQQIKITSRERLPISVIGDRNEKQLARWLQHVLFNVERHESQEWLKRDGVILDDPHKGR